MAEPLTPEDILAILDRTLDVPDVRAKVRALLDAARAAAPSGEKLRADAVAAGYPAGILGPPASPPRETRMPGERGIRWQHVKAA